MITIYETRELVPTEEHGDRWITMYNARRPQARVRRAIVIAGPVVEADLGYGVWGGQLADGAYAPHDILLFACRSERGLSIASEG